MSGLDHEFVLLSCREHPFDKYCKFINNPKSLRIHDDLLHYISDTLQWIPMYNPSKKIACQGLCWTGPTIIKEDGAKLTRDIFKLWSDLFNNGPKTLILRGLYTYEFENDPAEDGFEKIKTGSGKYDQITFDREEVREKFDKIVSYADQVIKSDGDLYILHLGI